MGKRRTRKQRVWGQWFPLLTLLYLTLLVCSFSTLVLPPDASKKGRLVQRDPEGDILSLNNVRLELPPGTSWKKIRLSYRVKKREALSLILDRRGDHFTVLRVSRAPALRSGVFTFSSGKITEERPLESLTAAGEDRGRIEFLRNEGGIVAVLNGETRLEIAHESRPGDFELVLFPPWSTRLFHRVALEDVILSDGKPLPDRSDPFRDFLRSFGLHLVLAPILAFFSVRGQPSPIERLFRCHARWKPGQITIMLTGTLFFLCVAAYFLGSSGYVAPIGFLRKMAYRGALVAVMLWSVLYFFLRDRILCRSPRYRTSVLSSGILLFPVLLIVTVAIYFFASWALRPVVTQSGRSIDPGPRNASMRVACYGGSSTVGYPFPAEWPYTWPQQLEHLLKCRGIPSAVVWNLGMPAATIREIEKRIAGDLAAYHPTHVVLYSVGNNVSLSAEEFQRRLHAFLEQVKKQVPHVLMVEEQDFSIVYDWCREDQIFVHYAMYEEIAKDSSVPFLNPRGALKDCREEFLFIDKNGHLTKYGYARIAESIAKRLEASAVLP